MDCNAQFSEIFLKTANCDFVNDIDARAAVGRKLVSLVTYMAFCTDCDKNVNAENEVFVNYVSFSDLIKQIMTQEL